MIPASPAPRRNWRSTPLAIFGTALLILLVGIGIIYQSEATYQDNREQAVLAQARVLSKSTAAALDFDDPVAAQQAVDYYRTLELVRWIGVYDRNGRAVAGYARDGQSVPPTVAAIGAPPEKAMRVTVPVETAGQVVGNVFYETDRDPLYRRIQRYLVLGILIVMAALVVGALGMAQLQLRRANRQLADRAEALAQANDTLAKVKNSGVITMGVRDRSNTRTCSSDWGSARRITPSRTSSIIRKPRRKTSAAS